MSRQSVVTLLDERNSRRAVSLIETSKLRFEVDASPEIEGYFCCPEVNLPIRSTGMHTFLNSFTPMPQRYASKLRELGQFTLLRDNIQVWINELRKTHTALKVVTEDGHVIAVGSQNFQPVLTSRALEALPDDWRYEILTGEIRDRVRLVEPSSFCVFDSKEHRTADDPYHLGFQIGNSEIGMGALNVDCFLWRLVCTNGAIVTVNGSSSLIHQIHVSKDPERIMDSFNRMVPRIVKRIPELHETVLTQLKHANADVVKQTHRALLKQFKEDAQVSQTAFARIFGGPVAPGTSKRDQDAWLDTTWTGKRLELVNVITRGAQSFASETRAELEELAGRILHSN
jgi:hypothetical protein